MRIHALIKAKREALGFSDVDVAQKSGLSIYEYGDIEQHENELFNVTALHQVRRLARVLGLSIDDIMIAAHVGYEATAQQSASSDLPRNSVVGRARKSIGLSREQLAEALGYGTDAVDALETDPMFLENWSLDLIVTLAKTLRLQVRRLLEE